MSKDLEYNYTDDYHNEEKQCRFCDSFKMENDQAFCSELEIEITENGHCDFFRSKD